jgi:hypothetical protein
MTVTKHKGNHLQDMHPAEGGKIKKNMIVQLCLVPLV